MKRDDLIVIALCGGAAYLIAKAAGLSLPSLSSMMGTAQTFSQSIWRPFTPDAGTPYDPLNPGALTTTTDLVNGSIHDWMTGNVSGSGIPTVQELIDDTLADMNGTGQKSIVRVDGAWW